MADTQRSVFQEATARLDARVGEGVEKLLRMHHRRRLRQVGRVEQLDPPEDGSLWTSGEPPPRAGSELEVLIDGADALPRIAESILAARERVHIAGWHIDPHFGLTRDTRAMRLRDLLGEVSQRAEVRVLLWAGAPIPLFTPDRSQVAETRRELIRGTAVQCALDGHERPMHCHHEKLVIVDGEIAFVGGIDLTSLAGDRFDESAHPMRSHRGWHDLTARICGPPVADVEQHFTNRWLEATGQRLSQSAPPQAAGNRTVQIVRTVPERTYDFAPRGDFSILESYMRAFRSARKLIYIENQFLWSPQVVDVIAAKLKDPPAEDFRVLTLLPAKPDNGSDTTRGQLGVLIDADRGKGRLLAATISTRSGALVGPLYVHAKLAIVDDAWMTLGSANLNEHSLLNDSEMNVVTCDRELIRQTRLRLWSEHLELTVPEVCGDPTRVMDELWRPIADEQLRRRQSGEPATHRMRALEGVSRRSMALLGPIQGLAVDG